MDGDTTTSRNVGAYPLSLLGAPTIVSNSVRSLSGGALQFRLTRIILFRGLVRIVDYGYQARLLTGFWQNEGRTWDWQNRIVYLPKSP